MSESVQRNKFVASLIRIIAQKEQQLNAYRHHHKHPTTHRFAETTSSTTDNGPNYKSETTQSVKRLKEMEARVKNLEEQLKELTFQLTEQTQITAEYQQNVKDLEAKEKQLSHSITTLSEKALFLQNEVAILRKQKEEILFENSALREQVETLKVQAHYSHILQGKIESLTRQLSQWQKFQQRIRQNIESLTKKYCHSALPQPSPPLNNNKLDYLLTKLNAIQHCLQMQHIASFPSTGLLDDTLHEMLMLMQHRQEKLEAVAEEREEFSSGEREGGSCDCQSDHTTAVKESISHH